MMHEEKVLVAIEEDMMIVKSLIKTGEEKIGDVKNGVVIEEDVNLMVKMEVKTGGEVSIKISVGFVVEVTVKLSGTGLAVWSCTN